MAAIQTRAARVSVSRRSVLRVESVRPCVVRAVDSRSVAIFLTAAGILASPAFAEPDAYTTELLDIIKARGTDLDKALTEVPAESAKRFEVVEAPPAAVTTAVPVEQRKELIRAEAVFESELAQTAVDAASTNAGSNSSPAAPRINAARKSLSSTASSSASPSAALGVLGVLALAGGAAYYVSQANSESAAAPAAAAPVPPTPAAAAPPPAMADGAASENKTPTAV